MSNDESAPHVVVRAFERLVLFPTGVCVLSAGVISLFENAWRFGAFLLLMALSVGAVGQSLPHRKKQSTRELYSQNVAERFGNITHEESAGLAKAVMLTAFLVAVIAAGAALHRDLSWYWVLGYFVGSWVVFPMVSIVFCFGWSWTMEKMNARSHNP